jgi:hypothetical protein
MLARLSCCCTTLRSDAEMSKCSDCRVFCCSCCCCCCCSESCCQSQSVLAQCCCVLLLLFQAQTDCPVGSGPSCSTRISAAACCIRLPPATAAPAAMVTRERCVLLPAARATAATAVGDSGGTQLLSPGAPAAASAARMCAPTHARYRWNHSLLQRSTVISSSEYPESTACCCCRCCS